MKCLADQNRERRVALALGAQGHDVTVGVVDDPGHRPDQAVRALAAQEERILLTNDPDFGELVARYRQPHAGVILFRMSAATAERKIERLDAVFRDHADPLSQLIVVTEQRLRVYPSRRQAEEGAACAPHRRSSTEGAGKALAAVLS
jgi:predicted nuclease of predicted toxin-antitoxin system